MIPQIYPDKSNTFGHLHRLWEYREFLASLVRRNLKAKYQGSFFGFLWTLLNPLMTVLVLTVVFTHIVRIQIENYWAFLLSGYFVWNFIAQSLSAATFVLAEHGELSRSIAYPKEVPLIAAVVTRLIEFFFEMGLIMLVLILFHHGMKFPVGFLFLPWLLLIQFLIVLAVMFPLATLSVYFRDIHHGLPIVLTTLFYITPIFYSVSMVTGALRVIFILNPFAYLLTLYQQACYQGAVPSLFLCCNLTGASLLLLWIGYVFFNHFKEMYAEII